MTGYRLQGGSDSSTASAVNKAKAQSHRQLIVWQKAMDLVVEVYKLCRFLPANEQYALTSQIRRAAVSMPANIAEGSARGSANDYAQFLAIAKGSLMETETLLTVALRVGYLTERDAADCSGLIVEISKMLTAMRSKLRT